MPQFDPDAPWYVNVLLIVLVLVIVPWLTNRGTKKKLAAMGEDISASRQQVENEHKNTDFPNLRDEITAMRTSNNESFESLRDQIGGMHSEVRDVRNDVTGIRTDARRDRRDLHDLQRVVDEVARKQTADQS